MMRNNDLSLLQEFVGNANPLAQQAAGISAQIENQPLEITEFIEGLLRLLLPWSR